MGTDLSVVWSKECGLSSQIAPGWISGLCSSLVKWDKSPSLAGLFWGAHNKIDAQCQTKSRWLLLLPSTSSSISKHIKHVDFENVQMLRLKIKEFKIRPSFECGHCKSHDPILSLEMIQNEVMRNKNVNNHFWWEWETAKTPGYPPKGISAHSCGACTAGCGHGPEWGQQAASARRGLVWKMESYTEVQRLNSIFITEQIGCTRRGQTFADPVRLLVKKMG